MLEVEAAKFKTICQLFGVSNTSSIKHDDTDQPLVEAAEAGSSASGHGREPADAVRITLFMQM